MSAFGGWRLKRQASPNRPGASLPWAIGYALEYRRAFERRHFLPLQLAAIFGQPFAERSRSVDIGVGIIRRGSDQDGAQGAEPDERAPAVAVANPMPAAPD